MLNDEASEPPTCGVASTECANGGSLTGWQTNQ